VAEDEDGSVAVRTVTKAKNAAAKEVSADICVVGAGISGVSAALEAAKLGRRVALVDGLPALGGQAVNSIIGTFCGLFSNGGTDAYQVTHGIADDILHDLGATGDVHYNRGPLTTVVLYDEIALGRWVEQQVRKAGITVIVGAILRGVERDGRRIKALDLATRYGDVHLTATGFVDASGDAVLTWEAGLPCRIPDQPVYGTQVAVIEHVHSDKPVSREDMVKRLEEKADQYGLTRKSGIVFYWPGRDTTVLNMTHVETPLDPVEASQRALDGKDQADRAIAYLKGEFPETFGDCRVRAYGCPGIRQTRWIKGRQQLTLDDVRAGTRFPDAVVRTAWPVELHNTSKGYVWETFGPDHLHYIPLGALLPPDVDNLAAVGRCMDGDAPALSSVRVMGPCMGMGAAAAHALDLAGSGSVHQIDNAALQKRLERNIEGRG
jgi:2-polyprenyl-6-methoxyphenol hydroxylase-like FAD-dependent oxidoreductase